MAASYILAWVSLVIMALFIFLIPVHFYLYRKNPVNTTVTAINSATNSVLNSVPVCGCKVNFEKSGISQESSICFSFAIIDSF